MRGLTPVLAELALDDSVVQLVRIKCHKSEYNNVFLDDQHLLNVTIEHQCRAAKAAPQVGRYTEEGSPVFSRMGSVMFRPAGRRMEARGIAPPRALQCWLSDKRLEIVLT